MDFKFTATEKDGYILVSLEGSLIEMHQADNLFLQVDDLILNDKNKLVIDLGKLEFINHTGIAILVKLYCQARKNGGELIIYNLSSIIQNTAEGQKILKIFRNCENEKEAVAALA